jgi:hypothetical protein
MPHQQKRTSETNLSMLSSYSMSIRTWKKRLFFHLTDLVTVDALIIHRYCGGIMNHIKFRKQMIKRPHPSGL